MISSWVSWLTKDLAWALETNIFGAANGFINFLMDSEANISLWNTYAFFVLYANIDNFDPTKYNLEYDQLPVMDKFMENQSILILDEPMNGLDNKGDA